MCKFALKDLEHERRERLGRDLAGGAGRAEFVHVVVARTSARGEHLSLKLDTYKDRCRYSRSGR